MDRLNEAIADFVRTNTPQLAALLAERGKDGDGEEAERASHVLVELACDLCERLVLPATAQGPSAAKAAVPRFLVPRPRREGATRGPERSPPAPNLARLQAVFAHLADGVILTRADGEILEWNPAALEMHGFADADEVRMNAARLPELLEVSTPAGRALAFADWPLSRLLRGESVRHEEVHVRRPASGVELILRCDGQRIPDPDGGADLVLLFLHDLSTERRAQARSRQSAQMFEALVREATDVVFVKDRAGRYQLLNEAAARAFNRSEAELRGSDDSAVFDADSARRLARHERTVLETGCARSAEEHLSLAGEERTFLATWAPYRASAGEVLGLVGIWRDITARATAIEELRRREAQHRAVLETTQDGFWMADGEGRLLEVNEAYVRRSGYSRAELLELRVSALEGQESPADVQARIARIREFGHDRFETLHRAKDGRLWPVEVTVSYWPIDGGRFFAFMRDTSERMCAAEALRTSQTRLAESQRVAGLASWFWVPESDEVWWSEETYRMLGLDPLTDPPSYELFLSRIHPEDRERVESCVRDILGGGSTFAYDARIVRPDGTLLWLHTLAHPTRDAAGHLVRLDGLDQDITAQKCAAEALRASEERYRRLVEVLPEAVFVASEGCISFCNPAMQELLGASERAQILGLTPYQLFAPADHERLRRRIEAAARAGPPAPGGEKRLLRFDGHSVAVHLIAAALPDAAGSSVLFVLHDLTAQKRSTQLLQAVMESVPDAILTLDAQGAIRAANPAVEGVFACGRDELLGRPASVLFPDSPGTTSAESLAPGSREVQLVRGDGRPFPAELTVSEFSLEGERHLSLVIRDITQRRELEAQFLHAQRMEAVGRLAGGVAHDFNNLLTVIQGYSDFLLARLAPGSRERESVSAIHDASLRAARLTQQLLAFSRKSVVDPQVLDLCTLVRDLEKLLRRLIGEDVVLRVEADAAPCRIHADRGQVEQVLLNLAVNARDAMPTGGVLSIATRCVSSADGPGGVRGAEWVELCVSDEGCGMTPEVATRIFEPFFTTKDVGLGTGLGLSVVHGIVKQHGGSISVSSTPGAGTTFRLRFPRVSTELADPAVERAGEDCGGTEVVLLAEDESAVRRVARHALEKHGYTVLEAGTVAEALFMAREPGRRIDLLVTDVVMPVVGGRLLAEEIQRLRPGLRVLYMSGYADDAVLRHGVTSCSDSFLSKPFSQLELVRKVREVLDRKT